MKAIYATATLLKLELGYSQRLNFDMKTISKIITKRQQDEAEDDFKLV